MHSGQTFRISKFLDSYLFYLVVGLVSVTEPLQGGDTDGTVECSGPGEKGTSNIIYVYYWEEKIPHTGDTKSLDRCG